MSKKITSRFTESCGLTPSTHKLLRIAVINGEYSNADELILEMLNKMELKK